DLVGVVPIGIEGDDVGPESIAGVRTGPRALVGIGDRRDARAAARHDVHRTGAVALVVRLADQEIRGAVSGDVRLAIDGGSEGLPPTGPDDCPRTWFRALFTERTVEDLDRTRVVVRAGRADHEILLAIPVRVAHGERGAEFLIGLASPDLPSRERDFAGPRALVPGTVAVVVLFVAARLLHAGVDGWVRVVAVDRRVVAVVVRILADFRRRVRAAAVRTIIRRRVGGQLARDREEQCSHRGEG